MEERRDFAHESWICICLTPVLASRCSSSATQALLHCSSTRPRTHSLHSFPPPSFSPNLPPHTLPLPPSPPSPPRGVECVEGEGGPRAVDDAIRARLGEEEEDFVDDEKFLFYVLRQKERKKNLHSKTPQLVLLITSSSSSPPSLTAPTSLPPSRLPSHHYLTSLHPAACARDTAEDRGPCFMALHLG